MLPQRYRLRINVGNLLELVAAAAACWGVYRLEGFAWMLILAAVLLAVGAEFIYDATALRIPLPHLPHPVRRARTDFTRARVLAYRAKHAVARRRG